MKSPQQRSGDLDPNKHTQPSKVHKAGTGIASLTNSNRGLKKDINFMQNNHHQTENEGRGGTTPSTSSNTHGTMRSSGLSQMVINSNTEKQKNPGLTKRGTMSSNQPSSMTAGQQVQEKGSTANEKKRLKNPGKEDSKKQEKDKKESSEPWWPPFQFDGRHALTSKLCLNLRNCQYDLFRTIALNELGWRIVDHRNRVIEPSDKVGNGKVNDSDDEEGQPHNRHHDPNNWDIFWADSGMTPEFLGSLSNTQRANHFLGMYNICRKSTLGMHLKRF